MQPSRPQGLLLRTAAEEPPAADSDGDLVARAREGDAAAVEALLAQLAPPLLRAIRALIGATHPDVEDLLQEVLIAVVDALPSFRGDSTLLHFAIRIATRKVTVVRRRSRSVRNWLEGWFTRERPTEGPVPTPGDETVADRRRALLRTLLGELPDSQAEALVLRVALGHSIEEIAAMTCAPVNTVRSRLRLAKEAIRGRVESDPRWAELGDRGS